jgi:hypothetical protein
MNQLDVMVFGRQDNGNNQNGNTPPTNAPDGNNNSPNNAANTDNPNNANGGKTTPSPTPTKKPSSDSSKTSSDNGKGKSSDSKGKGSDSHKTTPTTFKPDPKLATKTFAATVPAGGVKIQTPAAISGPQYYKIGDNVTFGWNYTSLRATPTKIDILVSCQSNQATYTVAANASVQESGLAVWDTKKEARNTAPLPMASYTLIILDSNSDISATPEPGHLNPYNQLTFGMYAPQDYTPLPEFQCPTCNNAAMSVTPKQTMTLALISTGLTVLSFTWFARGFGVL